MPTPTCLFRHPLYGPNLIVTPAGRKKCRRCNQRYRQRCERQARRHWLVECEAVLRRIEEAVRGGEQ